MYAFIIYIIYTDIIYDCMSLSPFTSIIYVDSDIVWQAVF